MLHWNSTSKVTDKRLGFPNPGLDVARSERYKGWNEADCNRGSHLKREKFAREPAWGKVMSSIFDAHEIMRPIRVQEGDWQSLTTHESPQPPRG